jgi:hypothetical protein
MKKIIAIDFMGVICDPSNVPEGKKLGQPIPGALDALQDLYDTCYVIIHTTMANTPRGRQIVAEWLDFYDVDYHEISGKPKADYYLDNHALEFKSWALTKKKLGMEYA